MCRQPRNVTFAGTRKPRHKQVTILVMLFVLQFHVAILSPFHHIDLSPAGEQQQPKMLRSFGTQTTLHSLLDTCEQCTWTPDAGKELDAMLHGLQHNHIYLYSSIDDDYLEDVNTFFYSVTESELMDTDCKTDDETQCSPPEQQQKFIVFE